ncbi:hypothetical protein WJX74_000906 [Apatococcus lobatus]|uniref:Dipeptidylpeptidase IV N-terminal domain-containing protein n=1 Tax=Apatococcus lobatus TaxID=904363 RepID=A0AAW1S9W4_9CHLO
MDIYDLKERSVLCSRDKGSCPKRLSLSPSGKYFTMPHAADVRVYSNDGVLEAVLESELPATKISWGQVAWSPDELRLSFWPSGAPSTLCLFEIQGWALPRSIAT